MSLAISKTLREQHPTLSRGWAAIALVNMALKLKFDTLGQSNRTIIDETLAAIDELNQNDFLDSILPCFDDSTLSVTPELSPQAAIEQMNHLSDTVVGLFNCTPIPVCNKMDIAVVWLGMGVALFILHHGGDRSHNLNELKRYIQTAPFKAVDSRPIKT